MTENYDLTDYDYQLPIELIAQTPLEQRTASRLLAVSRASPSIPLVHSYFYQLPQFLRAGDLLVFNDSRVMAARLILHKSSGGRVEVMLERPIDERRLLAKTKAACKLHVMDILCLADGRRCLTLVEQQGDFWCMELACETACAASVEQLFERYGQIPLPPYIKRSPNPNDQERYQTIYAKTLGSVAAPTAGLHFDSVLMQALQSAQIELDFVTLHVGAGTFQPVRTAKITEHQMHSERICVTPSLAQHVNAVKQRGGRVIAVGTTSLRVLESMSDDEGVLHSGARETALFIYPGYRFKIIDGLITNFHLPKSSLLMLVAALIGRQRILDIYRVAIAHGYRFFSYGDAMLIY